MAEQTDTGVTGQDVRCIHCGDPVADRGVISGGNAFCCNGCRAVYEILHPTEQCPVIDPTKIGDERFAYLDEPALARSLHSFSDGTVSAVSFFVPQMHCSSCVFLLENLYRLDPGILTSRADFLRKTVSIKYAERETTLRKIVELLSALGYEPRISLGSAAPPQEASADNSLYYRVGIAGFCFGNIMILSFPEYLSGGMVDLTLRTMFSWLILALSLPVVFYCSTIYFRFAAGGLRKGILTIDVPIAAGILILFLRSCWEIITGAGSGYFDSLSGLVFFLLLGRLFQSKTYDALNFERTYASYFPLAVSLQKNGIERSVKVSEVHPGDRMVIRNNEIVPADAVVMDGVADIDYSFVTGESRTVHCPSGTLVYAGGRQVGSAIELEAVTECSQSHLTRLWNADPHAGDHAGGLISLSNIVSKYFTFGVLMVGVVTILYWLPRDPARALDAVTSVLIVACPCALALSTPFAFGTAQRLLGRARLYLKNIDVVERMARVTHVVLDKTGTLTQSRDAAVRFVGQPLSERERRLVATLVHNSHHPLSRSLYTALMPVLLFQVEQFSERANQGLEGVIDGERMRLGSAGFTGAEITNEQELPATETRIYLSINGVARGFWGVAGRYREGVDEVIRRLGETYDMALLTGDSDWERRNLEQRFGALVPLHFGKTPEAKRDYIMSMRAGGGSVLMVGDGLNDAVALREADVGIALTDDTAAFTPASDAILEGSRLTQLDRFLDFARMSKKVVVWSYGISVLYNIVGLSFAVRGMLSPIVAAILMPLSSITVVAFATVAVRLAARKTGVTQ
jgi:P-type Cu+ transporter